MGLLVQADHVWSPPNALAVTEPAFAAGYSAVDARGVDLAAASHVVVRVMLRIPNLSFIHPGGSVSVLSVGTERRTLAIRLTGGGIVVGETTHLDGDGGITNVAHDVMTLNPAPGTFVPYVLEIDEEPKPVARPSIGPTRGADLPLLPTSVPTTVTKLRIGALNPATEDDVALHERVRRAGGDTTRCVVAGRPDRRVVQSEALTWLDANAPPDRASVVTSLPDASELHDFTFEAWRAWFIAAVQRVVRWVPATGAAVFFQSDVRHRGEWVDKGYLVLRGAEHEGASVVWHKIVCRRPAGTVAIGRPSYSHMICVSRVPRAVPLRPGPDVLPDAGFMPWSRAMGATACEVACRFLRDELQTRVIVDPFCGRGTVLAVANALGLDAVGIDVSAKRCRRARALVAIGP